MDDYEDLDEFLEDPSKLDEEEVNETSDTADKQATMSKSDPEVATAMEDIQNEFAKLMHEEGKSEDGKNTVEDFKQLLNVLQEAGASETKGSHRESTGDGVADASNSSANIKNPGFKDIVSNTLDRLKENGTKVDENLMEEKKMGNTDDVLSQLLGQLVDGDGEDEEGVENAIKSMLNQMSAKEVLYQPMKEMHLEFVQWMAQNGETSEHADKMGIYQQQLGLVTRIVAIYEQDDYEDGKFRDQVGQLLDELEQLGDSPVSKGFSNPEAAELNNLLEINGDDGMANLDKELQDSCKQQ